MTEPYDTRLRHTGLGDAPADSGWFRHDQTWGLALTQLLVELEPIQRRMIDLRTGRAPAAPFIEAAVELVQHLVDFVQRQVNQRLKKETLNRLLQLATGLSNDANAFLAMGSRRTFFGLLDLFTRGGETERRDASPAGQARRRLFRDIVRAMFEVIEGFFVLFTTGFATPAEANSWRSTYEVFLAELDALKVHFASAAAPRC